MSKIYELNKVFEDKNFFTSAKSYNDLLGYARGLARLVDSKDAKIITLKEDVDVAEQNMRLLKKKYVGAMRRDPKTGRYLKRK